ncbi:DUF1992 domain-containing protein [Favolaschia claudopus]|uniref:DUF1992 domain-containing protein n=1 Tax=Favolaschia claudopus TaxID=2862362 RepID=A0AAV9Z907_9AGAR
MLIRPPRLTLKCPPRFSTSSLLRCPANPPAPESPQIHPPNESAKPLTGSAKLFADAAREEAEAQPPSRVVDRQEDLNWTGDERIEDMVLRMLIDKFKPLRTGKIQTAETKIRNSPPQVQVYQEPRISDHTPPPTALPSGGSWADVPLLPGSPDHRPWHTEFKVPTHAQASIRFARFPGPSSSSRTPLGAESEQTRRAEKEIHKKVGRLIGARESIIDYRLGLGPNSKASGMSRVNPVSVKGWTSLVEDRIERASRAGFFTTIKGQGKPLTRTVEESNPFIAREEFLMNRIMKRNGAVPPWVQLQTELESSLSTFRALLLEGWTRHAVRELTFDGVNANADPAALKAFRDPRWARREASYHAAALAEVNERVGRYNVLAPYAVRRPLYTLEMELASVYERAAEDVAREVAERAVTTRKVRGPGVDFGGTAAIKSGNVDWSWLRRFGQTLLAVGRSNAITLEQLTTEYPLSGSLITAFQFLVISLHGLPTHLFWSKNNNGLRLPRFKPRRIPLTSYLVQVALFYFISLLNNAAFSYRIPMSVHIIFRSGGLVIKLMRGECRYTLSQVCSVLAVTIGVVLTTFSASGSGSKSKSQPNADDISTDANSYTYFQGIAILTLALVFSGFLGLVQDYTYSTYAPRAAPAPASDSEKSKPSTQSGGGTPPAPPLTWQESMFYLHFLALPMFFFVRHDISAQLTSINAGPRTSLSVPLPEPLLSALHVPLPLPFNSFVSTGSPPGASKSPPPISIALTLHQPPALSLIFPHAYVPLLLNTVTQLVCVAGVHRLTTRVSALTVTLVLVVRKAVSLIVSVWMASGRGMGGEVDYGLMWSGAGLVLAGTVGYSVATGRAKRGEVKTKTE